MRPLIVGQAPARGRSLSTPFVGTRTGARLCELTGLSEEQLISKFELVNLVKRYPGKSGKGDAFPFKTANANVRRLMPRMADRRVLLLGSNVAKAFGLRMLPLTWYPWTLSLRNGESNDCLVALLPHPSGVNRWWNSHRNQLRAARFLRTLP